jgi:hypothetical protein
MGLFRNNNQSTETVSGILRFLGVSIAYGESEKKISAVGADNMWDLFEWLTVYALQEQLFSENEYAELMFFLSRKPKNIKFNYQTNDSEYVKKAVKTYEGIYGVLKPHTSFLKSTTRSQIKSDIKDYCSFNGLEFEALKQNFPEDHDFFVGICAQAFYGILENSNSEPNRSTRLSKRLAALEFLPHVCTFWFMQNKAN